MEIKCGFVEFYDKADKGINDFFKEANNKDFLGLRKLNIRISNMLFPIGHTLMPTLVYIYYLNAIYHALWNKYGKEPKADEINKWEMAISQNIVKQENVKEKGFLNEAKVRAFTYYKSNMEKMHYFKQEWKADDCLKVSALELLKKTRRYEFVANLINNPEPPEKIDFDDIDDILIDRLDDVERLDFIRRTVLPYDGKYSVFSNIVMYHCGIKRKPRSGETIYNDGWMYKYNNEIKTMSDLENFYCLESCFKEIPIGNEKEHSLNRCSDYKMALQYSKLQWIAKLAYNMCLFENNDDKRDDYKARLEEFIKDHQNNIDKKDLKNLKNLKKLDKNLDDAVQFIDDIYDTIKNKDKDIVIDELKELVRNRERDVMGDASILGSGIIVENPMGYYIDTFRWQYRAEDGDEESANVKDNINELKVPVWKSGDDKNLRNRCASYYIYELFYEPYE